MIQSNRFFIFTTQTSVHRRSIHKSLYLHQSGIDKIVENKVAQWLNQGGADDLKKSDVASKAKDDKHKVLAHSLGVGRDYVHSKILSDNNFKPESVQRRLDLEEKWDIVKKAIQNAYNNNRNSYNSVDDFLCDETMIATFQDDMEELNKMAKHCNDAIISDSLRFNGKSPVMHARSFQLVERIREALQSK